jgi:hypothetical protein
MDILGAHLPFVKEQIAIQERLARKYEDQPWRKDLHEKSAAQFRLLADDMVAAQRIVNKANDAIERSKTASRNLSLSLKEIEGLPKELLSELSISDADKLEFSIMNAIEDAGGILSLDKILIALYRETGEIHKRNTITSRLYRMAQKGMIFAVGMRKGIYSTQELSSDEVRQLLGREVTTDC